MSSRIEQLIDEIEDYIDNCKYKPFSSTQIIVDKEEIDNLLHELKNKTPDEIKRYQKIISNREAILNEARQKAEALINEATIHTNQLINEHEIMQQAYAQANEVVTMATKQAQEILDSATTQANDMRSSAVEYTDNLLEHVETVINQAVQTAATDYETLASDLNGYADLISSNRKELKPPEVLDNLDDELKESDSADTSAEGSANENQKTSIDLI